MNGRERRTALERIGIFGGTFNPPHLGHRHLAEEFRRQSSLDRILVIPSFVPPHKSAENLASGEDRMAMCRLTFPENHFCVDAAELDRGGKSYTVETLRILKERYGADSELFFLMGDDMLLYFANWRDPHEILRLATVVSAVRSNKITVSALRESARTSFPDEYRNGRFQFMEMPPLEVSSTEVRDRIREHRSIEGLVTPGVQRYIENRGLYQ